MFATLPTFYCLLLLLLVIIDKSTSYIHIVSSRIPHVHSINLLINKPNGKKIVLLKKHYVKATFPDDCCLEAEVEESEYTKTFSFLFRSGLIGAFTGLSVVVFKTLISGTSFFFYESLANYLPRPSFYWPLAICTFKIRSR